MIARQRIIRFIVKQGGGKEEELQAMSNMDLQLKATEIVANCR